MTTQAIETPAVTAFDVAEYGHEVKRFRDKSLTAANAATPYARETFRGLIMAELTPSSVVASLLRAFGNPKTPKGKMLDKLTSSSADNSAAGFGSARKVGAGALAIWEEAKGHATVMAIVQSFVLEVADCPKSFNALGLAVKAEIARLVALTVEAGEGDDEGDDEGSGEGEGEGDATPVAPPPTLDEQALMAIDFLAVYIGAQSLDAIPDVVLAKIATLQDVIAAATLPAMPARKAA